jgi:hypothetical protein
MSRQAIPQHGWIPALPASVSPGDAIWLRIDISAEQHALRKPGTTRTPGPGPQSGTRVGRVSRPQGRTPVYSFIIG